MVSELRDPPMLFRQNQRRPDGLTLTFAILLAAIAPAAAQVTGTSTSPAYSAQSIVNGATQTVEALAPNTIATIYGSNLAFSTYAAGAADIVGGRLPVELAGVSVAVNGVACGLFLVSPTQINFLVPYDFTAGNVTLLVARDGMAGPGVSIQLNATSPGLFVWNGNQAVGVHLNGQVISASAPATAGEIIVIYATGLGRTSPDALTGQLATTASQIVAKSQLQIAFNGVPAPAGTVLYAGLAPGFAGLYQINLVLPSPLPSVNPALQITIGSAASTASVQLIAR
jgi:uncharacterized protein (TIGR03437 family)